MSLPDSQVPDDKNGQPLQKGAEGGSEAFDHLCSRLAPALSHFLAKRGASADLCDELVQKVFSDLWERRALFRAQSSIETYVFSIARNTLSRELKRARRSAEKGPKRRQERAGQLCSDLSEPEAKLYLEELQSAIRKEMDRLTPAQRQALDAFAAVDDSVRRGSAKSDSSNAAQRNRLKRARKRLRELLAPFLGDDDRNRP